MGHKHSEWDKLSPKEQERLRNLIDGSYNTSNMSGGDKDRVLKEGKKRGFLASLFGSNKKNIETPK